MYASPSPATKTGYQYDLHLVVDHHIVSGDPLDKAPFVTPSTLLRPGAGLLGRLAREAAYLTEATCILRKCIDSPLADHASVAAIREPALVIVVDSPVWASRLRYQSEKILNHFAETLPGPRLTRIRTLVRPPTPAPRSSRGRTTRLSPSSLALMRNVSENLEPGPLRECLERFSVQDRDTET